MQVLTIAGNVGRDAVLRRTQAGDAVLGFSLAVDNGKDKDGNKRDSTWYDCSIWGKRGEALESYITKGSKLTLTGHPTVDCYEGKGKLGISVNELAFQGGGSQSGNSNGGQSGGYGGDQGGYGAGGGPNSGGDMGDDIPFAPEVRL